MTLLTIILFILAIGSIILLIDYGVHISQVKDHTERYGKSSNNIFIQEFNKCEWDNSRWKGSLFDYSRDSQIHAGIIKFNGIGMIMQNPIEYLKMLYFVNQYKTKAKREVEMKNNHVWKEEVIK